MSAAYGRRHLLATERTCLLVLSRAYRNTATSALQVLTGIPPITRKLEREAANTQILRLGKTVPGIDIDPKGVATKVSKYKTDSYKEYFQVILHKDHTGELHVYTNGPKNEKGRVWAAIVVYHNQVEMHAWQERLSDNNSVYQTELYVIYIAINWII